MRKTKKRKTLSKIKKKQRLWIPIYDFSEELAIKVHGTYLNFLKYEPEDDRKKYYIEFVEVKK